MKGIFLKNLEKEKQIQVGILYLERDLPAERTVVITDTE
jgi:hypothetical protein